MENPTEDQIQAMSNREFASLIRSQAELIDKSIHRRGPSETAPGAADIEAGEPHRRRQRQKV